MKNSSSPIVMSVILTIVFSAAGSESVRGQDDVAGIPSQEYQLTETPLRYFVHGHAADEPAPEAGYRVLIVLPGGNGSADFAPFVKRIYQHALSEDYVVVQLVSHQWSPRQRIVWPTEKNRVRGMQMSTESFLASAVGELKERVKIDERHLYALGWSSGGPAVYAAALSEGTPLTGAFVAMSVFKPNLLPDLSAAKGRRFYLLHSPDDRVCPYRMAEAARTVLNQKGASVELQTYAGGHGWRGDVFGNLTAGIEWLEEGAAE